MLYINQRNYPHIPYPTNMSDPDSAAHKGSIKTSGCGLCSMCMVVNHLTMKKLGLIECRDLSMELGANWSAGTDMKILGPVVAERFGLTYRTTDDIGEVKKTLHAGGEVIINVGGDHDGYTGVFTHGGHYMVLISEKDGVYCVLDPSKHREKFANAVREGIVRISGHFVYAGEALLLKESENRSPAFYLFERA